MKGALVAEYGQMSTMEPIAIVGMSSLFPAAVDLREFWENIVRERDCLTDVPASRWRIEDYYDPDPAVPDKTFSKRGGFIPDIDFDPMEFGLPPNILEVTDVSQLLALVVAREAFADAGYGDAQRPFDRSRTGVILGVGGGQKLITPLTARLQYPVWERAIRSCGVSEEDTARIVERLKLAYIRWEENSFPGMLGNVISGRIANRFDLGGTNCVVDAACASSLSALKMALSELAEGRSDLLLTGGVDTDNSPFMYLCFSKTPAFSRSDQIRPFDANSDGMMVGEGIGMMLLKRLADAERDGDRVYAVIRGIGTSSDGKFKSIYAPRPEGQMLALRRAYENAGFSPATVGLVEAHGTGTVAGDLCEVTALSAVLAEAGAAPGSTAIGSVKSQIGHTKAAAGAAGMIKAALALHHKVLPPTLNVTSPNAKFGLDDSPLYVNTKPRPWVRDAGQPPRRAGVSAFGFGGTNFHVVLEEYQAEHAEPYRLHRTSREVVVTAPTTVELRARCAELRAELHSDSAAAAFASIPLPEIPSDWARLGFVADSAEECAALLDTALAQIDADPAADSWQHPKGVFYRRRGMETAGQVVALFPGQGSQHVDMGRALAMNFPAIRQMIGLFDAESGQSVSTAVYPPPAFTDEQRSAQAETLRQTENAQPAIGALSAGMYTLLQRAGFTPDFTAGHSFGELTALWAAGVIDNGNFATLVNARGQAMAATGGDRGTMVAVVGEASAVERDIATCPGVSVANINAPDQVVIAGPSAAVDAAVAILKAKQYTTTPLPVSAAFHTSLVGDAQRPFERAVAECEFRAPQVPVYANVTAAPYPASPSAARALLGEQMLKPVRFRDQVENLYAAGGRIFVEIGPRDVLTNLVKATLGDRPHVALALNPKRDQDSDRQLRCALIQLRVVGVHLGAVDEYGLTPTTGKPARRPRLAVPLNGANYVSEQTRAAYQAAITENPSQPVVGCSTQETAAVPSDLEQKLSELFDRLHNDLAEMRRGQAEMLAALWHLRPEPVAAVERPAEVAPPVLAVVPEPVPVAVPEPAPVPAVPAVPVSGVLVEQLTGVLLEVVSENTGYPVDTLELDMDMESDLGIDSIKRVQILATMRQRFEELPGLAPEELAELRTLGQIVAHLEGKLASAGTAPVVAPVPVVPAVPAVPVSGVLVEQLTGVLLEVVSENTGYPVDTLELDMDMESDLGIDSIKRVQILATMRQRFEELPGLAPEELAELRTLGQIVAHLEGKLASAGTAPVVAPDPAPAAQPFVMESKLRPIPVKLAPLQAPDQLDYQLPESRTVVVTDDGTAAAPAIALALADRGWQPVLLRFPASLVARTEPLPGSLGRVGLNSLDEEELAQALQMIGSSYGPISGFLHVHPGSSRSGMFSDADDALLRHVFLTAKHLAAQLDDAARTGHACFVVVSRLDGQLGTGSDPAGATQGGLHGLVKTLLQERPSVHCRAIDIAPSTPTSQLVDMVLAELADPDRRLSVVGYGPAGRVTLVGDFASTNGSH